MEPSLRSSNIRVNECIFRRPDPAVHETTKRFVESLSNDNRISQYADLSYASKKLSKDTWYWLDPVKGGRSGYLVCLPNQPVIWVDEQFKQSVKIPMRVSASIFQKKSVFIATLNKTDGLLRLEDAWIVAGKNLFNEPFSKRWDELMDVYANQYRADSQLQKSLRIEMATYAPLTSATSWAPVPTCMIAQGETYPRRLRVQIQQEEKPVLHQQEQAKAKVQEQKQRFVEEHISIEAVSTDPSIARAVPHEEYPDTYNLSIGGQQKGYAAVQDLELSRKLRLATKDKKEISVKVEWNEEFNMYEILSQV
jgi:hypothetical protein